MLSPADKQPSFSRLNGRTYWGRRGAGALIYCPKTRHLLLGLRSGDVMEPYTWGGFGGKIDDDDVDPLDAALREVNEETEFDPSNLISAEHLWTYETPTFSYFNYLMLAKAEFEPQLNWENDDFGWFPLDALPTPQHYGLVAVLPYLQKAIGKLGRVSFRD
jgi:8-oxo-dGTP pyrophosphatase MutT (NUDIX family)